MKLLRLKIDGGSTTRSFDYDDTDCLAKQQRLLEPNSTNFEDYCFPGEMAAKCSFQIISVRFDGD
jgi:hypothetical protein